MEPCSFGVSPGDCYKTSYVRRTGLKRLTDFLEEERKVLLWRGGKRECINDSEQLQICDHHTAKLGSIFEKKFTKCCNLFHIHKRQVKGGHKISLDLVTKLLDDGYECLPGWQLCRACYDNAQKNEIIENLQSENESQLNKLDSTVTNFSTSDITSDEEVKIISRDSVNISLESIGGLPIKTHSMPKHRKLSYINEKLDKTMGCLKRSFAAAVGVDESSMTAANERCSEESAYEVKIKAADLDRLTEQMREKLTTGTTTYAEKV